MRLDYGGLKIRRLRWQRAVADPGEGPAAPHPLFLDQTEAQRAEKNLFSDRAPTPTPLSQGLDDRHPTPPHSWRSGSFTDVYLHGSYRLFFEKKSRTFQGQIVFSRTSFPQ